MICQSSWGLVLSLGVSHESKSQFLGVGWHKGWLAIPDRGLSIEIEESSSGGAYSNRQISRLQGVRCDT